MAVTVIQSASAIDETVRFAPFTLTVPINGVDPAHKLIAIGMIYAGAESGTIPLTISDDKGNTWVQILDFEGSNGNANLAAWECDAPAAGDTNVGIEQDNFGNSTGFIGFVLEVDGLATPAIDQSAATNFLPSSPLFSVDSSTSEDDEWVLGIAYNHDFVTGPTFNPGDGFASVAAVAGSNAGALIESMSAPTAGPVTATAVLATGSIGGAVMGALTFFTGSPPPPVIPSPTLDAFWKSGYDGNETPLTMKMWRFGRLVSDQQGFKLNITLVDDERSLFLNPTIKKEIKTMPQGQKYSVNWKARRCSVEIIFPVQDVDASVLQLTLSHIPCSER